jgi:hypothetical protein
MSQVRVTGERLFIAVYLGNHPRTQSSDNSVGIALGYGRMIGVLGFDSRRGLGIFLFTTASRTALGPNQPPTNV